MADQTRITDDKTNPDRNPTQNPDAAIDNICLIDGSPRTSKAGKEFRARYQALRQAIGGNIRHQRERQEMKLGTLAEKTGIKPGKLLYWEEGRMEVSIAGIIRIAAALGVSQARLLINPDAVEAATVDPDTDEEEFAVRDSFETEIDKAVAARECRDPMGFPDSEAISAMEEPMYRVMGAAELFYDYATALTYGQEEAPSIGLVFLSAAMKREADRVYRLYFGHPA